MHVILACKWADINFQVLISVLDILATFANMYGQYKAVKSQQYTKEINIYQNVFHTAYLKDLVTSFIDLCKRLWMYL